MATKAQEIDLVLLKHALIRRAMGRMADRAAFNFCFMLIDERPLFLAVALVTDLVPRPIRPQLFRTKRAVRAVAIIALDQALVHTVMEWPHELRAHIHMARVTELRRFRFHQKLTLLGMVRRVAIDTRNAIGQMYRAIVVCMFLGVLMASQTARTGLLRRGVLKGEDFGLVSAPINVSLPGAMTCLAPLPFHPFVRFQLAFHGGDEVRSAFEIGIEILMACLAGIGTHVKPWIRRSNIRLLLIRGLGLL